MWRLFLPTVQRCPLRGCRLKPGPPSCLTIPLVPGLVISLASPPPLPSCPGCRHLSPDGRVHCPAGPLLQPSCPLTHFPRSRSTQVNLCSPVMKTPFTRTQRSLSPACPLPTLAPAPCSPATGPLHLPPLPGLLPGCHRAFLWLLRSLAQGGRPWPPALTLSIA